METPNHNHPTINYPALVEDIRHELTKVYQYDMNPALVLDTIDILIHEHTGLACVGDTVETQPCSKHNLIIDPPPQEKYLWRVVYVIDVNALDAMAAAKEAYETMTDPKSQAPVLHVMDPSGTQLTLDLSAPEQRGDHYV